MVKSNMRNKLWRVVFCVWVFFWAFFLVRGLVKGEYKKFRKLTLLDYDEKRTYILGQELDAFLKKCEDRIPESASYKLAGTLDAHNKFRMIYYLYPRQQSDRPDYLLKIDADNARYALERLR